MIGRAVDGVATAASGLLAFVLRVGLCLAVGAFVPLYLVVLVLPVVSGSADSLFRGDVVLALVGGGLVLPGSLCGLARASRPTARLADTVAVAERDAPDLWRMVVECARLLGTRAPTELRLTDEAGAAVEEDARLFGLVPGTRRLYLGVPLTLCLSTAELRAVVCHELGHYARGRTRFGVQAVRGSSAMAHARRELARAASANPLARVYTGIPLLLLTGYALLYDWVSFTVRRRQEVDADAAAARIAGGRVVADALRSTQAAGVAWADFVDRFLEPARARGLVPDDPFTAFHAMVDDPEYRERFAEFREPLPVGRRGVRDPHPPLARRLAVLDRPGGGDPTCEPAAGLLVDRHALFVRLWRAVRPGPRLRWTRWLDEVIRQHVVDGAVPLRRAVRRVTGERTPNLEAVLDLLEAGRGAELGKALPDALPVVVGQALADVGAARWSVPWTGRPRLVVRDDDDLDAVVGTAVGGRVSRLRLVLALAGVDPADVVIPAGSTPVAAAEIRLEQGGHLALVLSVVGFAVVVALVTIAIRPVGPRPVRPTYDPAEVLLTTVRPGPAIEPRPTLPGFSPPKTP
ncbi:M48 family metallopeptidase [Saccharothrix violaceirubra]|uniref:Zn-dependent protease with chaperone function n=1 Tax=Saccharothrix violaceirubra TaxID=413306 RepID=A0A7W7T4T1_9PSEU|nr:M48 family metallopeptidase [Saccharothrix violaceirubra]MBB4966578.1 Zn-dependent protease with chaperone function [Saccharothrix violaceirubra]